MKSNKKEPKSYETNKNNEIDIKKDSKGIDLKTLILNAPTWTEAEYNDYLSARENINKSRLA